MVAAFRAALAGADVDDASGMGPQRQQAVFVENSQKKEAVDYQLFLMGVLPPQASFGARTFDRDFLAGRPTILGRKVGHLDPFVRQSWLCPLLDYAR